MAERNRKTGAKDLSPRESGMSGSGSDRSSSNIGDEKGRHGKHARTSGSREESMQGSSREFGEEPKEVKRSARGGTQDWNRDRDTQPGKMGDESPSDEESGLRGSSSGTTGLGGERQRSSTGSPGGVEGVKDESSPEPDEDSSRQR